MGEEEVFFFLLAQEAYGMIADKSIL